MSERFDARVSAPIVEDGAAVGVRLNGGQEVYADIVIDAIGPSAPLASDPRLADATRLEGEQHRDS